MAKKAKRYSSKHINLESLARAHTEMALRALCGVAQNGASEGARVTAAGFILDRGWGKPKQVKEHTGAGGTGPITVEIVYRKRDGDDDDEYNGK